MKKILLALVLALSVNFVLAQDNNPLFIVIVNEKYGFIDKTGKLLIEPQFDRAQDFSEGLALVTLNRKKFFIDVSGKKVIETKDFEPINGFTDGLARGNVTNRETYTKGYIDKTGKVVINNPKVWGACMFSEGLACVVSGKWGFIDTSGKYVIEPKFDEVSPFSDGLAGITVWDKSKASRHQHGFIDKTGRIVVKPEYDVTQSFSEGLAAVGMRKGDDYEFGFIDKNGVMVIKPQFDWTYTFNEGLAAVRISDKWGFIDKKGNIVIKAQFDKAEHFSEGLASVAVNGKYGFIDKTGKFVIEPKFSEAESFNEGLAFVKIEGLNANALRDTFELDTSGKWGYIDKTGKYIWTPTN